MDQQKEYLPGGGPPSKVRMILLILILLTLLLYLAQKMGVGPVKTEEKLEWIDR